MTTSKVPFSGDACFKFPSSPALQVACGKLISYSIERLHLHPAVNAFGRLHSTEISDKGRAEFVPEPILVTPFGTILAGFSTWLWAKQQGIPIVPCIEYSIGEDKALEHILRNHCQRRTWNSFVRIRMALTREGDLRARAFDNMRIGGKFKGSANLPNPSHIDVREEIARLAGVSSRSVSNAKTIIAEADPRVLEALENGTLRINGALHLCQWPKNGQLKQAISMAIAREVNKHVRHQTTQRSTRLGEAPIAAVLEILRTSDAHRPGSIEIRAVNLERTILLVGRDLLSDASVQGVLTA